MKLKGLFLLFGLLFWLTVNGQTISFLKSYGNSGYDYGRDVKQAIDTGYICTGSSSSFTADNAEAFLFKVDSLGDYQWSRNYGGEGTEWGESVVNTVDSGFALCGYTNSIGNGGFDFYFVKTNWTGSPLIEKSYGGGDWDKAYDLVEMPDSGFVLVGETFSFGNGLTDAYIIRLNKYGDTLWTKTFGGQEEESLSAVIFDGDSIVTCGYTKSFGSGLKDGLILKLGLDGQIGWVDTVGQSQDDYFTSIDFHSTYYVLGGSRNYDYLNNGQEMWVYKIENDNSLAYFDSIYEGPSGDDVTMDIMIRDLNEDMIIAGITRSWGVLDGEGDIIMAKYDQNFGYVTNNTYGEAGVDKPYAVYETYDDGFIMIGDFKFNSIGGNNFILMKNNYLWDWFDIFTEIQYDSLTLNFESNLSTNKIDLYPNPANEILHLSSTHLLKKIMFYDLSGKLVLETEPTQDIDLTNLKPGTYLIRLIEIDSKSHYSRIIKL